MPNTRTQRIVVLSVVISHLLIMLILASWTVMFLAACFGHRDIMVISNSWCSARSVVTWSQTFLLASWAALSYGKSYIKFPLAALGIFGLYWIDTEGAHGGLPNFAVIMALQSLIVVLSIKLAIIIAWLLRQRDKSKGASPPFQYSLRLLLLWTTIFALFLGLGKIEIAKNGWTFELLTKDIIVVVICSFYHAYFGLLAVGLVFFNNRWLIKLAIVFCSIMLFVETRPIADSCFRSHGYGWGTTYQTVAYQAVYVLATLLPLRWCGVFGEKRKPIAE